MTGKNLARDVILEDEVLFICDDEELLEKAKNKGIATNNPQKMRESYTKAMEMLKAMGVKGVQK